MFLSTSEENFDKVMMKYIACYIDANNKNCGFSKIKNKGE